MCDIFKILGNFWEFYGNFWGIFWQLFGKFFGTFFRILWEFFGNSLGILWESLNFLGILWEFLDDKFKLKFKPKFYVCTWIIFVNKRKTSVVSLFAKGSYSQQTYKF